MAGMVGIGIMGTAMMRNLVKDGFEGVGYDIADGAMARLAEAGGIAATSPRDVAEKAEILITSLPNVDAFEQVMAGQGGIASSNPGMPQQMQFELNLGDAAREDLSSKALLTSCSVTGIPGTVSDLLVGGELRRGDRVVGEKDRRAEFHCWPLARCPPQS